MPVDYADSSYPRHQYDQWIVSVHRSNMCQRSPFETSILASNIHRPSRMASRCLLLLLLWLAGSAAPPMWASATAAGSAEHRYRTYVLAKSGSATASSSLPTCQNGI